MPLAGFAGPLIILLTMAVTGRAELARTQEAPAPAQPERLPTNRIEQLVVWLDAVDRHRPGEFDASVILVSAWSAHDIRAVWLEVQVLLLVMEGNSANNVAVPRGSARHRILYSKAEADAFGRIAKARGLYDGINALVTRGALLHTDVAVLVGPTLEPVQAASSIGPHRLLARVEDGEQRAIGQSGPHWDFARTLLDAAKPRPTEIVFVQRWYQSALSYHIDRELYDKLVFQRAQELFPDDADIAFQIGCLHEALAGAVVQHSLRSLTLPYGARLDIQSADSELEQAVASFRKALQRNPDLAEARVHLGRVLGLRGRHAEAAEELRRASSAIEEPALLYYANLFLGADEEALARRSEARAAYERALTLYPDAQAARIALSQLARGDGRRADALRLVRDILNSPPDEIGIGDPWWRYYRDAGRHAEAMLDDLRKRLPALGPR